MNEDLVKDYLRKSGFGDMQADALSKLLAETATKDDLHDLQRGLAQKIDGLEARLRADTMRATSEVRSELSRSIAETRSDLSQALAETRADLSQGIATAQTQTMRWGIGMIIVMSSIFTLLDIFID